MNKERVREHMDAEDREMEERDRRSMDTVDRDMEEEGNGRNIDTGPDFSRLPDLVWIKIFQVLSPPDRYRLSQVCSVFNAVFHTPSVWRSVSLTFHKTLLHSYMSGYKLSLSECNQQILRKFGPFRDVTLQVRGRPAEMDYETSAILQSLQDHHQSNNGAGLGSLTLDIGDRDWSNRFFVSFGSESLNTELLQVVVNLLRHCLSLKRLRITHWPQSYLIEEEDLQLRQVVLSAECLKLKSLHLPRVTENGVYVQSQAHSLAVDAVSRFTCLTYLHLPSHSLTQDLLQSLATSRVETLSVEVNGLWSTGCLDHLMLPLDWSILTDSIPSMAVTFILSADIPQFVLEAFLVEGIPLVAITYEMNCYCCRKNFTLLHQYANSLRSLRCFSEPTDCELQLLDLVRACPKLQNIRFNGLISDYNVLKLAEAGKRRWGEFVFWWKKIEKTEYRIVPINVMPSCPKMEGGSWKTETEAKTEFSRHVSECLGFPWQPCDS